MPNNMEWLNKYQDMHVREYYIADNNVLRTKLTTMGKMFTV